MRIKTACDPDCPGRSATCHGSCEKYRAAWEDNQRRYAARIERGKIDELVRKSVIESHKKIRRKTPEY